MARGTWWSLRKIDKIAKEGVLSATAWETLDSVVAECPMLVRYFQAIGTRLCRVIPRKTKNLIGRFQSSYLRKPDL